MDQNITSVLAGLRALRGRVDELSPELLAFQLDGLIEELEALQAPGDVLATLLEELEQAESQRDVGRSLQGFLNWLMERYRRRNTMVYEALYRIYREAKNMRRYG